MADHARELMGALLGLHARTSLHPGAGTAMGVVDLPIQREKHTGWPMIQGSSIKGVLRDACREQLKSGPIHDGDRGKANQDPMLEAVFGPAKIEAGDATAWAGALSVTDARILAFPVRSLKGVFAWVTCPSVLRRLKQDAEIAGIRMSLSVPSVEPEAAIASAELTMDHGPDKRVVFEEFDFKAKVDDGILTTVSKEISLLASAPEESSMRARLAILGDDEFTHMVLHSTEVSARIALDYNTKTVSGGALFYQEFLPPETILYSILLADGSRSENKKSKGEIFQFLSGVLPKFLQVGGNETTGKGICAVKARRGGNAHG